jgi:hypothetical protein
MTPLLAGIDASLTAVTPTPAARLAPRQTTMSLRRAPNRRTMAALCPPGVVVEGGNMITDLSLGQAR